MLPPDLSIGGWNTVFVGTFLASAIYALILFRHSHDETRRLLLGFGLVLIGAAIRIGGWLPWRAMLFASNQEAANAWKAYSTVWTGAGALVMIVGMAVLMWPALKRMWGGAGPAVASVVIGEAVLFTFGVLGTAAVALFF